MVAFWKVVWGMSHDAHPPPPQLRDIGHWVQPATRVSRRILCIQLEISHLRGHGSCNRLSLRRCPWHGTYTFCTISDIRLSMYRGGALHNMGRGDML